MSHEVGAPWLSRCCTSRSSSWLPQHKRLNQQRGRRAPCCQPRASGRCTAATRAHRRAGALLCWWRQTSVGSCCTASWWQVAALACTLKSHVATYGGMQNLNNLDTTAVVYLISSRCGRQGRCHIASGCGRSSGRHLPQRAVRRPRHVARGLQRRGCGHAPRRRRPPGRHAAGGAAGMSAMRHRPLHKCCSSVGSR